MADVAGVLVDLHIVATGQRADEVIGECRLCRRLYLFIGGIELAVADVLADGALEQPGVLQHHAHHGAKVVAFELAHVVPADADGAGINVVEAHEQLHHGGLAGTGGAHDGHRLPRAHLRREIGDHRLARLVAEAHLVELDAAINLGCGDARRLVFLFGGVQELEHALGRGGHLLQNVGNLSKLRQRLGEVLHVLDERLNVAHRDAPLDGEQRTEHANNHVAQVAHERHDGHEQAG